jgi:1-acyl-sn-glycerol-3-phosphate acyltransferase
VSAKTAALGLYSYAEFGLCVAGFIPVMGASWLRHRGDPTQRAPGRWMRRLGRVTTTLSPLWKFRVIGDAPPDILTRAYVVVSNHESNADPFLLSHLPWDMRWIAKEELFQMPVIGLTFRFSGDVRLRRGEGESVRAVMTECRAALDAGIPVMIFPEGTRSKTGELLPFKDGAFKLAIDAGVPILPLAIRGTRTCMPKGSAWFGAADASVEILSPIATTGMKENDVPALRDRARDVISAARG